MVEKSCTQWKGTGDSAFFGSVLPGDMQVEGHTSTGCIYKVEKVRPYSLFKHRPDHFKLDKIADKWCREMTLAGHPLTFLRCSI